MIYIITEGEVELGDVITVSHGVIHRQHPITRVTKTLAMSMEKSTLTGEGYEIAFKRKVSKYMSHPKAIKNWPSDKYTVVRKVLDKKGE